MKKVKIAILGLGNVGTGVWKILKENKKEIMKRSNYEIEVARILVKDINKKREFSVSKEILTDNIDDIINDESIKIVVELIGGCDEAKEYMIGAMKAKKHIVTANKLVIANWSEELFKVAEEEKVLFYYEASVAGGIPIIREINESLTANRIQQITGIINGTTNYILSKMTNDAFNAIMIKGNAVGELMLYGRGAGDLPTGSAVVGDIISILRNNVNPYDLSSIIEKDDFKEIKKPEENESEFYIRLDIKDRTGVLGDTATIFGENNVSILSVTGDVRHNKEHSPLGFITHKSSEKNIRNSIEKIKELENVNTVESIIRIESFN